MDYLDYVAYGTATTAVLAALLLLFKIPAVPPISVAPHDYLHLLDQYTWQSGLSLTRQMEKDRDGRLSYDATYCALSHLESEGLIAQRIVPDVFLTLEYPCENIIFKTHEFRLTSKGEYYRESLTFGDAFTQHCMLPPP